MRDGEMEKMRDWLRSSLSRLLLRPWLLTVVFSFSHFLILPSSAQFNTDRLIMVGRSALYFEDYVLSIQYFNQAISAKPYLFEPWFLRGVAKYYLDDFVGAESDCTEAINLDGGGSSTMYIKDEGVINFPSDNKQHDHEGERPVSNAILVL